MGLIDDNPPSAGQEAKITGHDYLQRIQIRETPLFFVSANDMKQQDSSHRVLIWPPCKGLILRSTQTSDKL